MTLETVAEESYLGDSDQGGPGQTEKEAESSKKIVITQTKKIAKKNFLRDVLTGVLYAAYIFCNENPIDWILQLVISAYPV